MLHLPSLYILFMSIGFGHLRLFARHYVDTFGLLALWSTWCGNACVGGQETILDLFIYLGLVLKIYKQIIQIEHNIF